MGIRKVVILDGYTDEPAGLGVPPYINTYPRLVAGAIWMNKKDAIIRYWTIDEARRDASSFLKGAEASDLLVIIGGMEVPGKYLGGRPMAPEELERIALLTRDTPKALVGPVARFGTGTGGGSIAYSARRLANIIDYVVRGDPEHFFTELAGEGPEKADPNYHKESYELSDRAFVYGARIVEQHPNFGKNLIVEIETYRGCPRWITGGCSFCIEPRYGRPIFRAPESVVREVEALYSLGVRHIRLGKQPDILAYLSKGVGEREFPEPDPDVLERLLRGIRLAAPGLATLHIDNVNPGTIVNHREQAIRALKAIIKYHTPGDVAALGVESFDPEVVKRNNLKVMPEEALEAIRIINSVGRTRGWNGLPHLIPGVNLLHGLPGETKETYRLNYEYLMRILNEGLLVRRVNIRKVIVLENTPLFSKRGEVSSLLRKHATIYKWYRVKVMGDFDKRMMERVAPKGTLLSYLFAEGRRGGLSIARFPGSYPIAVKVPARLGKFSVISAVVIKHAPKSLMGFSIS